MTFVVMMGLDAGLQLPAEVFKGSILIYRALCSSCGTSWIHCTGV